MPKPKVRVELEADGELREGTLHPDLGATIEARFEDWGRTGLGVDYQDPDSLRLTLNGEFTLKALNPAAIKVGGALEKSLFDGKTRFQGSVTLQIPKDVSVEVTTDLSEDEKRVGAKVTFRFS